MGTLNNNAESKNVKEVPTKNQNEVLNAFSLFSFSAEKRKKEVSNPKVNRILTKEIHAYKLVNCANSSLLIKLM